MNNIKQLKNKDALIFTIEDIAMVGDDDYSEGQLKLNTRGVKEMYNQFKEGQKVTLTIEGE